MAAFSSNNTPRLGSLNLEPYFSLPPLPNIVIEWAAIIPLVCHLASYRSDYNITGEVALRKRIHLGLFPKLGRLDGLSRLLQGGKKFVDQASARGGTTKTVRDVQWGTVFACANGAAVDSLVDFLMSHNFEELIRMPEKTTGQDSPD
jgi:hypothetical protein